MSSVLRQFYYSYEFFLERVKVQNIISVFKWNLALYICQNDFFSLKIFRIDYENNKCYNIKNFILYYGGGIMKKNILRSLLLVIVFLFAISCGKKNDTIKIVFLPNETNDSLKKSREEFARIVQDNHKLRILEQRHI